MSQLYTSQPTVNRLLTIFSSLFHSATKPTRHLLAWLLIAQLALESASSVRCLFRQFLSKQTDASLNSYYRALGNGLVTDASIRQALTLRALAIVPEALRQEPILLSVDDTTIAKWGKHFDGVGILYDHAKHDGKSYFNGHAFVSLTSDAEQEWLVPSLFQHNRSDGAAHEHCLAGEQRAPQHQLQVYGDLPAQALQAPLGH